MGEARSRAGSTRPRFHRVNPDFSCAAARLDRDEVFLDLYEKIRRAKDPDPFLYVLMPMLIIRTLIDEEPLDFEQTHFPSGRAKDGHVLVAGPKSRDRHQT